MSLSNAARNNVRQISTNEEQLMLRGAYLAALFVGLVLAGCGSDDYSQPEAMLNEELNCPKGSVEEFSRWGGIDENGWSHSCKMMHGKFHAWRGDVLAIEGQYSYGKEQGKWIYRDADGKTYKVITYKDGKEVDVARMK
jgi:hypothetical protein